MRAGTLEIEAEQRARNVRFASSYVAKEAPARSSRARVLVSAFGPFPPHPINASAEVLARFAGLAPHRPTPSELEPARHVRVDDVVCALTPDSPDSHDSDGELVELRALVLPVFWDVAPWVLVAELAAFRPDVVLMTGIAADAQPIVLERGARNVRSLRPDASGRASPREATLVPGASAERLVPFPFEEARVAAGEVLARALVDEPRLAAVTAAVQVLAPRDDNAFLCNQVTFVVDHALAHGAGTLALLRSHDEDDGLPLASPEGLQDVPRAFLHWPAGIGGHLDVGAAVLRAVLGSAVASAASRRSECARAFLR